MGKSAITKVMDGELPAYTVFRGGGFHAFLDIHPATPGHTLVASEIPTDRWTELAYEEIALESLLGGVIGRRQEQLLRGARRIVRATFGDQDPRFHAHYIPSFTDGDVVNRMHPDSPRMSEPVDHDALSRMQDLLAFPADLTGHIAGALEEQRARMLETPPALLSGAGASFAGAAILGSPRQ